MISKNLPVSSLTQPLNQLHGAGIIQYYLTDEEDEVQRQDLTEITEILASPTATLVFFLFCISFSL